MRTLILILVLTCPLLGFSQSGQSESQIDSVCFKAKVELNKATKDGIYLKGYVVKIPDTELKKLDGKLIEVKGVVTIEQGLQNEPAQYDSEGNKVIRQGRVKDTKHIRKPEYRVSKD